MSRSSSEISSVLNLGRATAPKGPNVEIRLHDDYTTKVFNSGSPVYGDAIISPSRDTRFDVLSIALIGRCCTRIDAAQLSQHSSHTFLKMNMPISESAYPTPRVFEAGRTYTIPFNFVIPHHLTLSACNHKKHSDYIADQHMRLPPSMGTWHFDDMAPDMSRVEYLIKVRVAEQPELGGPAYKVMEGDRRINVLPTSVEDPPLSVSLQDRFYKLSKSKNIRKNLFSAKQGRLTATAVQPAAIRVASDFKGSAETSVLVNLTFEPTAPEIAPPKVNRVSAKLQSSTWFSATPMPFAPNMGDSRQSALTGLPQLSYSTSLGAYSSELEQTSWQTRPHSIARRDSGYSSEGHPDSHSDSDHGRRGSHSNGKSPIYHETSVRIPFKVSTARKLLLPTFHTCLVSRTYALQLSVTAGDSKFSLTVPVQVVAEPSASQQLLQDPGLPSFDAAMAQQEEAEMDELFRPRVLRQPEFVPQDHSGLPGYHDFSLRRPAVSAA